MKNKHLLDKKQMLVINNQVVLWEPAKEGETLFGDPLIGCARDYSHKSAIIRHSCQIKSVELPTAEDVTRYEEARKSHEAYMSDYYQKNSYTGD